MIISRIIYAVLTFFMSALHMALLLGAPIGEYVLGGNDKVKGEVPEQYAW